MEQFCGNFNATITGNIFKPPLTNHFNYYTVYSSLLSSLYFNIIIDVKRLYANYVITRTKYCM